MAGEEVGELGVRLSLDSSDFNRPLQSVERNLKALGGELATIRNKGSEWGKSLEGLGQKQEVLGRTLSTQETKVKSLREAYEKSVREKGADAAATENLAAKLNRAVAEYTRTETELSQVNDALSQQQEELAHAESAWGRMESSLDSAGDSLTNTGEKLTGIGEKMTLGVTTPIVGAGIAAITTADQFDVAGGRIQSGLGLSAAEAEKFEGIAKNLWKNGFGEDVNAAADAVVLVKKNLNELPTDQLEKVTSFAGVLADRFEIDIAESTNTAGMIIKTFGGDAEKAFDLMTYGLQNAKGDGGELLEVFNEYAPQFKALGYDAEGFMATLIQGSQSGAFNMDLLGDAAKESFLLIGEGSDDVKTALKDMGLDADQVIGDINSGGEDAQGAFMAVSAAISGIKDPTDKAAASLALFGTPLEDLGPEFRGFFDDVNQDLEGVEGSTQRAGDALYDNLGAKATSVFRDFQEDLEPVGEVLVDLADEWLPKIADTVGDLTEKFADMSPEAQENALMIAGIAAAAGPAIAGLGFLSTGLGSIAKIGSGLVGTLGKEGGKGLLGRIGLMAATGGPVGLAIAGVGLLGAGIYALNEASEESKEVNLEHAESMIEQQQSLEGLIEKYEVLADKNQLSNDELLRFRDIQSEMDLTTSAEELATLAEESSKLQEKSGLSNEELSKMLEYNDQLIEKVPEAGAVFSAHGEAILKNADDLNTANEKLRESIQLELELQQAKATAKLDENIQEKINATEEFNNKMREYNNEMVVQAAREYQLGELKKEQQAAYAAGQDEIAIGMESDIINLEAQIQLNKDNVGVLSNEVLEKQKSLGKSDEQIAKTKALYDELINLQLASAGINAKGQEGIAQLDTAISKSAARVSELEKAKESQGGLNAKQQEELNNLNTALGTYRTTKGEIQNIQGEQGVVNQKIAEGEEKAGRLSDKLGESEIKQITFSGDGYQEAKVISDEADKDVQKEVDVTDYGKANSIHNEAEKDAHKSVFVSVVQTAGKIIGGIKNILGFAHGTDFHPGGIAMVGDGEGSNAGQELIETPDGKRFLSPDKPTLMDLPRGTSVLSATKTREMLGHSLGTRPHPGGIAIVGDGDGSIPKYAKGTKATKPFELVNYDSRLKAVASGSGVARIREIRQAEIDSLEAQIAVLTKEGATIKELSQAKEKEARLSKLQAEKSKEYQSRIKEQQITVSALERAYKNKKITLSEYNTQVGAAKSEIHKLTAEQLAHNDAMKKSFDSNLSDQTKIRTIRQSNMELLEKEIESLKREGASQKELNQAKQKEGELNRLRNQKQKEYENRLKDQQKVINSINSSYKKGLITREKYNETIADATVEMNDLKMETLAFYESMSEAQEEATQAIREDLAKLMDEVASAQTEAFEKAMDKQLSALSDKQKQAESLFKDETEAFIDELNRQKDAAIDAFDQQTKAHEDSINQQIENINKRRDAELAAIDAQLAALEEKEKQESRDEVEAGWATEQANLDRRFKVADFMQDEETVKAVAQEQADLQNTIDKQRLEWQREDLKESLKLEQDKINVSYDQQEEALKTALDLYNEQRDLERDALEERYEMREQQYEAMRALQLEAMEREHEMAMEAAERELELQKQRFEALHEELVKHLENGTMTQKEANKAWMQAVKDAGIDQVYQEIENQEKSKAELDKYVAGYLKIGKSYGDNLVNGVIGTLNSRLSQVQAAAARLRDAMGATAGLSSTFAVANAASNHSAIAKAVPAATSRLQPINFNLDGQPIAEYVLDIATGAVQVVSRKG